MQLSQDIKPISYLKAKTANVINDVNENKRPVIITQNGEAKAVVQDIKSYEDMKNAISMLKLLALAEEDIRKGNLHSQEEVFEAVEELLNK